MPSLRTYLARAIEVSVPWFFLQPPGHLVLIRAPHRRGSADLTWAKTADEVLNAIVPLHR
jgi:hypothetical protein